MKEIKLAEAEFKALEDKGYTVEYVTWKGDVMHPAFDLECCEGVAHPRGTKLKFLFKNGRDSEQEEARERIGESIVTVKFASVGTWSSTYQFEEVEGKWNTVMFGLADEQ